MPKPWQNSEGYNDPTAYAVLSGDREPREQDNRISALMHAIRAVVALSGFEIVGRITFRDRNTGREYR